MSKANIEIVLRPAWYVRSLDALSQWINATFLNGDANESVSGRAARVTLFEEHESRAWNVTYEVINKLFFLQYDHCLQAYLNDVARAVDKSNKAKHHLGVAETLGAADAA